MIGFYTGLRISDVSALTWDDIDLGKRTITGSKQVVKRNFGAGVKDVQERLGHTNIQTTLQTYVHDTESMKARSVDLFEQAVTRKTS